MRHKQTIALYMLLSLLIISLPSLQAAVSNANQHFTAGEQEFKKENYAMAVESFAAAIKYAPQNLRARFRYGQSLFSLNRYPESYNQFQTVLQNSPNNIIARVYLAENLLKLERADEARPHLEWILQIQPGHERANQLLAKIETENEKSVQAAYLDKEEVPDGFAPLPVKDVAIDLAEAQKEEPAVSQQPEKKVQKSRQSRRGKKAPVAPGRDLPPTAQQSTTWDVAKFVMANQNSFMVNLEYGRYCIEKGDLAIAAQKLAAAEKLAIEKQNTRRFLEVQILNSLVYIYSLDFSGFGRHLVKLKPLLGKESYQSFLDIYNQARELNNEIDLARLSAGVAMGAGHYAVAARLLKQAVVENPDNLLLLNLLADAQMQNLEYPDAEATLQRIAQADEQNAESYFNLARFYLTASYKPDMARKCAMYARSLRPEDSRIAVMLALLDYAEGNIEAGLSRMHELLPAIEDPSFKAICQRIINDGNYAGQSKEGQFDFMEILALPGAAHAPKSSYRLLATEFLQKGSYFSALRYFLMAQDIAEVGRTYLGFASALNSTGEGQTSAIAAGFGLQALRQHLSREPDAARANLYLALYHFERDEFALADRAVKSGLHGNADRGTRQRLTALLNSLANQKKLSN